MEEEFFRLRRVDTSVPFQRVTQELDKRWQAAVDDVRAETVSLLGTYVARSSNRTELLLKCHLLVEAYLTRLVEAQATAPEMLAIERTTFPTKVSLAAAFGMPADLVPVLNRLNRLRNDLAHRLHAAIEDAQIAELAELLPSDHDDVLDAFRQQYPPSADQDLQSVTGVLVTLLALRRARAIFDRENYDLLIEHGTLALFNRPKEANP